MIFFNDNKLCEKKYFENFQNYECLRLERQMDHPVVIDTYQLISHLSQVKRKHCRLVSGRPKSEN